jgi:hypothetical protein
MRYMKKIVPEATGLTPVTANLPDWRSLIRFMRGSSTGTDDAVALVSAVDSATARVKRDFMMPPQLSDECRVLVRIRQKKSAKQPQRYHQTNANS